jgi:very-short-patch-repair endonuclease/predicted transcriptional regulator of viral defense system
MTPIDVLIDTFAASQLGLVTRSQLLASGVKEAVIDRRVRNGRLRLVFRGVYRVGPLMVSHARELAAVLVCGPHAVLSHRSAAALWQVLPASELRTPIDVILTQGDRGRRPGIRVHRVSLQQHDVTRVGTVPVTTVSRTLLDLATQLGRRELEQCLAHAERLQLIDCANLLSVVLASAGRPGAPVLRALLQDEVGPALTRSEAEERFLALVRKAQLPAPETNVRVDDYEVDFFWRRERLVVEVDGYAFHSSERRFEGDRLRDGRLTAAGFTVVRVTWRQVAREPEAILVRLAQSLARAS